MPKRLNDDEDSGSESLSLDVRLSPNKRSKTENTGDSEPTVIDSSSLSDAPDEESEEEDSIDPVRDEEFYFEDGSVVLLVGDVLFKVHASILKSQSDVLEKMLSMPLVGVDADAGAGTEAEGDANEERRGTYDEKPIVIPEMEPIHFRNFMKMIYYPPSAKFFLTICLTDKNKENAWQSFKFYSDVARLSHRFGVADTEQWATSQLKCLIRIRAKDISSQAEGDDPFPYFLNALWYAGAISDFRLLNRVRNLMQQFCTEPDYLPNDDLVSLFRTPDLREKDPPLFGFLFTLLLSFGHEIWDTDLFTRTDRMAFFSAQCYLTPFPSLLTAFLETPLFVRPTSAATFSKILAENPAKKPCTDKCHQAAFTAWEAEFDDSYYKDVNSKEILTAIGILAVLPERRLRFFDQVRNQKCAQYCYWRVVDQLDRDINRLYTRLAEYYREIN